MSHGNEKFSIKQEVIDGLKATNISQKNKIQEIEERFKIVRFFLHFLYKFFNFFNIIKSARI